MPITPCKSVSFRQNQVAFNTAIYLSQIMLESGCHPSCWYVLRSRSSSQWHCFVPLNFHLEYRNYMGNITKLICSTALLCSPDLPDKTSMLFFVISISEISLSSGLFQMTPVGTNLAPELGSHVVAMAGPFLCRIPEQKGHTHGALKLGPEIPAGGYSSVWEVTE